MYNHHTIQEDLVVRARAGDSNARAELYRLYVKAMYHHCIRITQNKEDAEDVLQDAFIYAFNHLHELINPASFGGWLRRIVIGNAVRFCRKAMKWGEIDEADEQNGAEEELLWWTNVSLEAVHEAIKHLPDGCRQVFALYVFEDFGHKDIAASLGISESTSKSQYQRARKLLKERLTTQIQKNG